MNIKEVKKLVTSDIIFSLLVLLGVSTCLLLTLMYIFAPVNAKADTMQVNCTSGNYSSCVGMFQGSNATSLNTSVVNNYNTTLSNRYVSLTSIALQGNVNYTFRVTTSLTRDIKNIYAYSRYAPLNEQAQTYSSYLNYTVSKAAVQNVYEFHFLSPTFWTGNPTSFINIDFGSSGGKITKIEILESDGLIADSIEGASNGVIGTIQGIFGKCTYNAFNKEGIMQDTNSALTKSVTDNGFSYSRSTTGWYYSNATFKDFMPDLIPGKSYKISYSSSGCSRSNFDFGDGSNIFNNGGSFIYTSAMDSYPLILHTSSNTCTYYNIIVQPLDSDLSGNIPFGNQCKSLLDTIIDNQNTQNNIQEDIKDLQQQQTDFVTDNSDPVVDSSGIQNTINSVQVTNPLSYLLTLPTNLLDAIITGFSGSNICRDFELGKFGVIGGVNLGTYTFKFPCINIREKIGDTLYNTIDIIVGIGFLVMTIVKLYNTISNYLTLGAEDEVKSHSYFLTPMDFLGSMLGGNYLHVSSSIRGGEW